MAPKPLQKLYDNALLFLDDQTECNDHYWATGIVRAIRQVYPDCGGSHTATANIAKEKRAAMKLPRGLQPSCQDPPLIRNHVCSTPGRCSVGDIVRELRKEDQRKVADPIPAEKQLTLFAA